MPELDSFLSLIGYLWGCSGNPGNSVLKWGLGQDIRLDWIIAENLSGPGHVAGSGDQKSVSVSKGLYYVCTGVSGSRSSKCADITLRGVLFATKKTASRYDEL